MKQFTGEMRVNICIQDRPEMWGFTGLDKDIGKAFTEAYVLAVTQLAFDGMGMCRVCTVKPATLVMYIGPDRLQSQIRCEECASLAHNYPEGWEKLNP